MIRAAGAPRGVVGDVRWRATAMPMRRSAERCIAAVATAVVVLGGCAMLPRPVPSASASTDTVSGRLSVRVDGEAGAAPRSLSAAFELGGNAEAGQLNLSTPLGSVLAQARWAPGSVVLMTPQEERSYADLDAMTRELLGESLPVAALFDWLRGRPWPGAPSTVNTLPAESGFEQLGWAVSLARFDEAWVAARRERPPVVSVRAKVDRP